MRRCVLVSSRVGEDAKTNEDVLFLTMYRLPNKMSNGGLWYPRQNEAVITTCINKARRPEEFEILSEILPCTLVDVHYSVNEFTNKSYVSKVEVVKETVNIYDADLLYR